MRHLGWSGHRLTARVSCSQYSKTHNFSQLGKAEERCCSREMLPVTFVSCSWPCQEYLIRWILGRMVLPVMWLTWFQLFAMVDWTTMALVWARSLTPWFGILKAAGFPVVREWYTSYYIFSCLFSHQLARLGGCTSLWLNNVLFLLLGYFLTSCHSNDGDISRLIITDTCWCYGEEVGSKKRWAIVFL